MFYGGRFWPGWATAARGSPAVRPDQTLPTLPLVAEAPEERVGHGQSGECEARHHDELPAAVARRDRAAQERAQFADHMVNKVAGDVAEDGNGTPSALLLRSNGATGVSLKVRQSSTAIKTAEMRAP